MNEMLRLWALVTGVVLCGFYFGACVMGARIPDLLPMAIAAVAGFELFFFGQEAFNRARRRHG